VHKNTKKSRQLSFKIVFLEEEENPVLSRKLIFVSDFKPRTKRHLGAETEFQIIETYTTLLLYPQLQ
jgi:hypothetical protein